MSFISYAQNFEDVILWRALRHVQNGTYVDIGAQDPVVDSVSKAFYEHGWRGLHVEPVPFYADQLRRDRPDEIVLQAALGESEGTVTLNVIAGTGLSTAVDVHANRHHEAGFMAQSVVVPMLTMKSALHMLAGREVHWLKIDVEGFEKQVLQGWDPAVLRPWVLVIEATIPGSSQTDYAAWEPLVLAANYEFVYFDGLNRFFVAQEHPELKPAFASPPNVFDDFQLSGMGSWGLFRQVEATIRAEHAIAIDRLNAELDIGRTVYATSQNELAAELATLYAQVGVATNELANTQQAALLEREAVQIRSEELAARYVALQTQAHEWWSMADRLSKEMQAFHASRSWRLTLPLRRIVNLAQRLRHGAARLKQGMMVRARSGTKTIVIGSLRIVLARSGMRARLGRMLNSQPRLKRALRSLAVRAGLIQGMPAALSPTVFLPFEDMHHANIAKRAMRIYVQLKNVQTGKS